LKNLKIKVTDKLFFFERLSNLFRPSRKVGTLVDRYGPKWNSHSNEMHSCRTKCKPYPQSTYADACGRTWHSRTEYKERI